MFKRINSYFDYGFLKRHIFFYFLIISSKKNRSKPRIVVSINSMSSIAGCIATNCKLSNNILDATESPTLIDRTTNSTHGLFFLWKVLIEQADLVLAKSALTVIAPSPLMAEKFSEFYGRKVEYIPNAVKCKELRINTNQRRWNKENGLVYIAFPGSLSRATGLFFALDTIKRSPKNWRLVLIGSPTDIEENDLKRQIAKLRIEGRIIFTGYLEYVDYIESIKQCDIGWVLLDYRIENCRICLPNRLIDIATAEIKYVSTFNAAIRIVDPENVDQIQFGDCKKLIETTQNQLLKSSRLNLDAIINSTNLSWASIVQNLTVNQDKKKIVWFISTQSLKGRMRVVHAVNAFTDQGWQVVVFCRKQHPEESLFTDLSKVEFIIQK